MKKLDRIGFECALYRALGEIKEAREGAAALLAELYPGGTRVEVLLKHGQKKWSPATVIGRFNPEPGYVSVEIDNAKPKSRQRYRDVFYTQVRRV